MKKSLKIETLSNLSHRMECDLCRDRLAMNKMTIKVDELTDYTYLCDECLGQFFIDIAEDIKKGEKAL